jgi:hypothetical protein
MLPYATRNKYWGISQMVGYRRTLLQGFPIEVGSKWTLHAEIYMWNTQTGGVSTLSHHFL